MRRTTLGAIGGVVLLVAAASRPASAEPIRWEFHGSVGSVTSGSPEMQTLFPNGGDAVFSVTIDPDLAASCFSPNCYSYNGRPASEFTFEATIAGHRYFLPNLEGGYASENLWTNPGGTTGILFDNSLSEILWGDHVGTTPSYGPHALDFVVRWPSETQGFGNLPRRLPTSPVVGDFNLYLWTCRDVGNPGCVRQDTYVSGSINSAVSIPEPATFALLGLGLVGMLAGRRAFRKTGAPIA
jgi:hypothetical protein